LQTAHVYEYTTQRECPLARSRPLAVLIPSPGSLHQFEISSGAGKEMGAGTNDSLRQGTWACPQSPALTRLTDILLLRKTMRKKSTVTGGSSSELPDIQGIIPSAQLNAISHIISAFGPILQPK
jgi:hypothetical protein